MKSAFFVVACLLGAAKSAAFKTDEQLDELDLSSYSEEALKNFNIKDTLQLIKKNKVSDSKMKKNNLSFMEHRLEVWEDKLAKLDKMESLMDAKPDEVDQEVLDMYHEAELDIKRILKYDMDNYVAEDEAINELESLSAQKQDDLAIFAAADDSEKMDFHENLLASVSVDLSNFAADESVDMDLH